MVDVTLPARTDAVPPLGDRAVRIPVGETTGKTIPALADRRGKFAKWNATTGEWEAGVVPVGEGGGATAVVFSDLSGLSFDETLEFLWSSGYAEANDGGQGWLARVHDDVELDADGVDGDGVRWRCFGPGQILRPEMCGAVGDAELELTYYQTYQAVPVNAYEVQNTPTDDTAAFVRFYDLLSYWHSFHAALTPGRNYWFSHVTRDGISFADKTVTFHDGRTATGRFIETDDPVPVAVCWDGFTFDCTGARFICDGHFTLTSADYLAGTIYRLKDTMIPFNLWKCSNFRIVKPNIDGQWRHQKTETGAAGECFSYGIYEIGSVNGTYESPVIFDMAQDAHTMGHRNKPGLTNVERYPEPDQSTPTVYNPGGRCWNLTIFNPAYGPCRRQGISIIGVGGRDIARRYAGLTVWGGVIREIGRYMGEARKWLTGDTNDSVDPYQYRGFPPRLGVDLEPQGAGPYQIDGVEFIGTHFENCVGGFIGAPGDWGLNRVEQSVPAASVNTTTNTFSKAALTLPGCYEGEIACPIRLWNDAGDPPAPLEPLRDYFIPGSTKTATSFQLSETYEDAVNGNVIDLADAGTGTTWFVYHDSHPNVGTVRLTGCTGLHPSDGSLAPFQITCESFVVDGGAYENRAGTAFFGPSQSNREYTVWQGVEFRSVRYLLDVDSYQPKSGVTFQNGGEDVTYANHGIGKYEYTTVRFKSTGGLPPEVVRNRTYYAKRNDDDSFQIAKSIQDAEFGSFITFSSAGTGTHSWWKFNRSEIIIRNGNRFIHTPRDLSFDAADDVDLVNNRIRIPSFKTKGDGFSQAEPLRLRYANESILGSPPGGLTMESVTYYAIPEPNAPEWVMFGSSASNANGRIPIDLTSLGEGRLTWAPTNSIKVGDIADGDFDFEDNTIFISRAALMSLGGTQTVWSIIGARNVGGNKYETDLQDTEGFFRAYYAENRTITKPEHYFPPEVFAATNVSSGVNFISPQAFVFTGTLNPGAVAPGTTEAFTTSVPGLLTTDRCFVEMQITASYPSLIVQRAFCATDGTLTVAIANVDSSGPSMDAPASSFTLLGVRIG